MAAHRPQHLGTGALEESARPKLKSEIRAFFGLPVPNAQLEELAAYLSGCAEIAPEFRWTPAANLHLTIRFVGSVEPSTVDGIAAALDAGSLPGFELELAGLGTFKGGRLVRVVWLGLRAGADKARELATAVEVECVRAGLDPETRPFRPHLTLARARSRDGSTLPALPSPPTLKPWPAEELVLYRSHLGRGSGAVYEPLRRIRLR